VHSADDLAGLGLTRSSVASNSSLTHIAFLAATMALGPSPTPTVPVTLPVAGSILETVRSSELATHTAPGVTAMPAGPEPT
jgi:ethanolamine transporter EutH